jgi:hypothetical protein
MYVIHNYVIYYFEKEMPSVIYECYIEDTSLGVKHSRKIITDPLVISNVYYNGVFYDTVPANKIIEINEYNMIVKKFNGCDIN